MLPLSHGSLIGSPTKDGQGTAWTFRTSAREVKPADFLNIMAQDFTEKKALEKMLGDDLKFISIMQEGIKVADDGHIQLPLPSKDDSPMPVNRSQADVLLSKLKHKLEIDEVYRGHYFVFMSKLFDAGHAEEVTEPAKEGREWYLPHHGVYNPRKPDKLRVVFNASIQFRGHILNKKLLQGPDQLNNLVGVLCRYRKELVTLTCDIEGMFHQVQVRPEDRDYFRFLWFPNNDLTQEPRAYRMKVHLFGATSSPGCANCALRWLAEKCRGDYGNEAADFILKYFYVDDGTGSVCTIDDAIQLMKDSRDLCRQGGFNLTKFCSNRKEVVEATPEEARLPSLKQIDLNASKLPSEHTLGVLVDTEEDCFIFKCEGKTLKISRRKLLSVVCSIFDPLGLISPYVLKGRMIL